jgi:plastocyanin
MSGFRHSVLVLVGMAALAACGGDPVSQPRSDQDAFDQPDASLAVLNAKDHHGGRHIAILDDCDPSDPGWAPTGGCVLRNGAVTEAEFGALLASPLSLSVVGHPAWRTEPSYLRLGGGKSVRVTNEGGRGHTFTPVAAFGGGRIPPLNIGLTSAPECLLPPNAADPYFVAPGGRLELDNLVAGDHRFMCCIHPWMRALIKVE